MIDLSNLIEKEGLASQANDIRNAIDCSFTGGELFGASPSRRKTFLVTGPNFGVHYDLVNQKNLVHFGL